MDKDRIRREAEGEIRAYLSTMPETTRARFKEISEKHFPEALNEIKKVRARFEAEESYQQQQYLMRRLVYLYKTLAINVGLHLVGARHYLGFTGET